MLTALSLLVVTIVALELGLRWADNVPLFTRKNFVRERVDLLMVNALARYDATLGWTVVPNFKASDGFMTFTTDEHGMRLPSPEPRPVPPGAILASGDSFTVGAEVSDDGAWPAILEGLIGIPVANASSGGWGTDQIILRAEQLLDVMKPATVIISFLWQDILRAEFSIYGGAHKPYYTVADGKLVLHNTPAPLFSANRDEVGLWRAVFGYSYAVLCAARKFGFPQWYQLWDLQYRRSTPQGVGVDISNLMLKRLKDETDKRGMRLLFLMQYGSNDFDQDAPPEMATQVNDYARAAGIETFDPWAAMKAIHDADHARFVRMFVLQADGKSLGHMSAEGNRFIAEYLAPALLPEARPASVERKDATSDAAGR